MPSPFQNLANIRARTDDNGDLIVSPSASGSTFLAVDGTVPAPGIAFVNQTTTGFARIQSGSIDFVSAGYSASNAAVRLAGGQGVVIGNGVGLCFTGSNGAAGTIDTTLFRGGTAQSLVFGNNQLQGGVTTTVTFQKAYSAIADNVATATCTVTIPNAAHSAMLQVTLVGSLGAGGAIGANEASGTISYSIGIARTAGVNAVAVASTAFGSGSASVAGAATLTITAAVSAIAGAVGATNTFTVNVTIARGSGSSTNHTCQVFAQVVNANATGVTIA